MGILSGLGRWPGTRPPPDAELDRAIERAVATVDPLLKTVSGYQRKLAPVVAHALDHCQKVATGIPGPIEISTRAFSADPLVHALFSSSADIADMLGRSRDIRAFLEDPGQLESDEFFAVLGMRRREKVVMGIAQQGATLQNDVPQRLLYFADHTLAEVGCDADATRKRLQAEAFDSLVAGFAEQLIELRQERQSASTAASLERGADVERRRVLEDRQRQAIESLAPERLLASMSAWLAEAEKRVFLKPGVAMVDRMGVIATHPGDGERFSALDFPELVSRDRRHWIVMVARISREEAKAALLRHEQAHRYLVI